MTNRKINDAMLCNGLKRTLDYWFIKHLFTYHPDIGKCGLTAEEKHTITKKWVIATFRTEIERADYTIYNSIACIKRAVLSVYKDIYEPSSARNNIGSYDHDKLAKLSIRRIRQKYNKNNERCDFDKDVKKCINKIFYAQFVYNTFADKGRFHAHERYDVEMLSNQLERENEKLQAQIGYLKLEIANLKKEQQESYHRPSSELDSLAQFQFSDIKTTAREDLEFIIDKHNLGMAANIQASALSKVALSAINTCVTAIVERNETIGDFNN